MSKLLTNTSWCVVLGFIMALGCVMGASPARAADDKGYVVFEYTTQENLRPDHVPAQGAIVDTVSCTLARDEHEPVQIGVHASADRLTTIRVTVESDLEMTVYHRIDPDLVQMDKAEKEMWNGDLRSGGAVGTGGTPLGVAAYVGWMGGMGGNE